MAGNLGGRRRREGGGFPYSTSASAISIWPDLRLSALSRFICTYAENGGSRCPRLTLCRTRRSHHWSRCLAQRNTLVALWSNLIWLAQPIHQYLPADIHSLSPPSDMAPPSWATDEQWNWLIDKAVGYREAQKSSQTTPWFAGMWQAGSVHALSNKARNLLPQRRSGRRYVTYTCIGPQPRARTAVIYRLLLHAPELTCSLSRN